MDKIDKEEQFLREKIFNRELIVFEEREIPREPVMCGRTFKYMKSDPIKKTIKTSDYQVLRFDSEDLSKKYGPYIDTELKIFQLPGGDFIQIIFKENNLLHTVFSGDFRQVKLVKSFVPIENSSHEDYLCDDLVFTTDNKIITKYAGRGGAIKGFSNVLSADLGLLAVDNTNIPVTANFEYLFSCFHGSLYRRDFNFNTVKKFPPFELDIIDVYVDEKNRLFLLHAYEGSNNRLSVYQFNQELTITKLYESLPIYDFDSFDMVVFLDVDLFAYLNLEDGEVTINNLRLGTSRVLELPMEDIYLFNCFISKSRRSPQSCLLIYSLEEGYIIELNKSYLNIQ
jgi:hypothetical protein